MKLKKLLKFIQQIDDLCDDAIKILNDETFNEKEKLEYMHLILAKIILQVEKVDKLEKIQ